MQAQGLRAPIKHLLIFFFVTESDVFLLYAKKTTVSATSLDPSNTKDQMIPVRQLKTAVGVDFSFDDQYVYWSDISADSISRVFLNGSGSEAVISDGKKSQNLY